MKAKALTINERRLNGYWILGMSWAVASQLHQWVTCRKTGGPQQNKEWLISLQSGWALHHSHAVDSFCCCPFLTQQGVHKRSSCHLPLLSCCSFWDVGWRQRIATLMVCAASRPYMVWFVRSNPTKRAIFFVGSKNELKEALSTFFLPNQFDVITNAPHSLCWWCMGATENCEKYSYSHSFSIFW